MAALGTDPRVTSVIRNHAVRAAVAAAPTSDPQRWQIETPVILATGIDEVRASDADLLILGVQRLSRRQKLLGTFAQDVVRQTNCPVLLISRAR
ncbi:MAG: universal stress protein [Gammaproteobacteria bacterium]|nr:universal stress protein [Gammaproteobacteria bacterium]